MYLVVFQLDGNEYALPLLQVREILGMTALLPLPRTHEWFAGMLNLRGQIIPVLDLRRRLGLIPAPYSLNTPIIIAELNERIVGLVADAVNQVVTLPPNALAPTSEFGDANAFAASIARMNDHMIVMLDLARVINGAEELVPA